MAKPIDVANRFVKQASKSMEVTFVFPNGHEESHLVKDKQAAFQLAKCFTETLSATPTSATVWEEDGRATNLIIDGWIV